MVKKEGQPAASRTVILVDVIVDQPPVPVDAVGGAEDVPHAGDGDGDRTGGDQGGLEIDLVQWEKAAAEPLPQAEVGRLDAIVEDDTLGKAVYQRRMKGVGQKAEDETGLLHPGPIGGRKMFRTGGEDRQTVPLAGQREWKGIVGDIAVDDRIQGPEDRLRGLLPPVGGADVRLHQRAVALLRLRLEPGREAPGPGGGADQPDRLAFPEGALPNQGQIKTACNQPAGSAGRSEIGRDSVQAETACTDNFIGPLSRPDANIFPAHSSSARNPFAERCRAPGGSSVQPACVNPKSS